MPFTVFSIIFDNNSAFKWDNIPPAADKEDLEKYPIILFERPIK